MMVLTIALACTVVWLWLFPPDGAPEGLRKGLILFGLIATIGCGWATQATMSAMMGARDRAIAEGARREAEKEEMIRKAREGDYPASAGDVLIR